MKPIIAFDLDGVLLRADIAVKAHKAWFELMSTLLKDPSVKLLADKKDYFPDAINTLSCLTALDPKDSFNKNLLIKYSRNLFQLLYLAELKKAGENSFVPGIVDMIIELKKECRIALITTSPEDVVLPAMDIGKVRKIFDYVYRAPLDKEPSKLALLSRFTKEISAPSLYIGNELADAKACKELKIKFALAKWDKYDEEAEQLANFNLNSPKQLKGIVGLI
jgi:phosphoglycolate phosphatase-like HAD superfamily hydrolase